MTMVAAALAPAYIAGQQEHGRQSQRRSLCGCGCHFPVRASPSWPVPTLGLDPQPHGPQAASALQWRVHSYRLRTWAPLQQLRDTYHGQPSRPPPPARCPPLPGPRAPSVMGDMRTAGAFCTLGMPWPGSVSTNVAPDLSLGRSAAFFPWKERVAFARGHGQPELQSRLIPNKAQKTSTKRIIHSGAQWMFS